MPKYLKIAPDPDARVCHCGDGNPNCDHWESCDGCGMDYRRHEGHDCIDGVPVQDLRALAKELRDSLDACETERDRLRSELDAAHDGEDALRSEVDALRHEVELTNEHEHQILTERNEARAELERTKEELERVRRNHLRRMAHTAWLRRDYPRSTPISFCRRGQYDRFALACSRAALERKGGA